MLAFDSQVCPKLLGVQVVRAVYPCNQTSRYIDILRLEVLFLTGKKQYDM